jgi:glycosyltransferase involved in cell wall biosynthesis
MQLEASIIIPTYNRAETLIRAMNSVLYQTCQNFELIIVDDGSTDETREVVESRHDPRIRYLRHAHNRGPSAARNTGMRAAKGNYIAWLDSDDEWFPNKLEEQLRIFGPGPNPVEASSTGYYIHSKSSNRKVIPFTSSSWSRSLLLRCDLAPGSTLLFRRSVLSEIGYLDEQLIRYEDWDWLIRFIKRYDLAVVNKPLVRTFSSEGNDPRIIEESALLFIEKHREDFASFGWHYRRRALARRFLDIATGYYNGSNKSKTLLYLLKTVAIHPINYPEAYLGLLDVCLGTVLFRRGLEVKERLIDKF